MNPSSSTMEGATAASMALMTPALMGASGVVGFTATPGVATAASESIGTMGWEESRRDSTFGLNAVSAAAAMASTTWPGRASERSIILGGGGGMAAACVASCCIAADGISGWTSSIAAAGEILGLPLMTSSSIRRWRSAARLKSSVSSRCSVCIRCETAWDSWARRWSSSRVARSSSSTPLTALKGKGLGATCGCRLAASAAAAALAASSLAAAASVAIAASRARVASSSARRISSCAWNSARILACSSDAFCAL